MLRITVLLIFTALPAAALELNLPVSMQKTTEVQSGADRFKLPMEVWDGSEIPSLKLIGGVTKAAYISKTQVSPKKLAAALLPQLIRQEYEVQLQCSDSVCGGFDFRFGLQVLPPPDMYVDLGNFAFISARKGINQAVWILVSNSLGHTHLQVTTVQPSDRTPLHIIPFTNYREPEQLRNALVTLGKFTLSDLIFQAGAANLEGESFATLDALAAYLREFPTHKIILVGHTDSKGPLTDNITLSKKRAYAVQALFTRIYKDIASERVKAEGVGYLSPVSQNETAEGRKHNRRVEVVIWATQ
jgi:outer membrane protein OmpA-like peptidoglycan-associated protein